MSFPSFNQYDVLCWIKFNWATSISTSNESTLLVMLYFGYYRIILSQNIICSFNRVISFLINWWFILWWSLLNTSTYHFKFINHTANIPLYYETHFISWVQCSFLFVEIYCSNREMWWLVLLTEISFTIILNLTKKLILFGMLYAWNTPEANETVKICWN